QRFVGPGKKATPVVLPIHSESRPAPVPLPGDRVTQLETPAGIEGSRGLANKETGLRNGDRWGADSQALVTIPLCRRSLVRAQEEVRKTEIIHQCGAEYTGQSKD